MPILVEGTVQRHSEGKKKKTYTKLQITLDWNAGLSSNITLTLNTQAKLFYMHFTFIYLFVYLNKCTLSLVTHLLMHSDYPKDEG